MQRFVKRKLRQGAYASADQIIEAGLAMLQQREKHADFAPGELDRLLAQGETDIRRGDVYDGEQVFRELEELSAARRRERRK